MGGFIHSLFAVALRPFVTSQPASIRRLSQHSFVNEPSFSRPFSSIFFSIIDLRIADAAGFVHFWPFFLPDQSERRSNWCSDKGEGFDNLKSLAGIVKSRSTYLT
jgi:hypothetical protein